MKEFNEEWNQSVELFGVLIASKAFHITLKHPVSKKNCEPHEALFEVTEAWKETQSLWDRQSLMFEIIFDLVCEYLKPWQIANYLVADRQPLEAFEILQNYTSKDLEEEYRQHCASLAKTLCSLTYYEDSLVWALKAYQSDPANSQFEVIVADSYYLVGRSDEANHIYQSRISLVPPSPSDSISQMFLVTFSIKQGVIPSPIFAIQFGQQLSNAKQSEEFWKLAEAEFYYSPYFRSHHAYYLASKGQIKECLSKLIALVQEMPWLQEASLNLIHVFEYFNQGGERIMPDFQKSLSEKILSRGWTNDKMFILQISSV